MLFIEEARGENLGPIFRSNLFSSHLPHYNNSSQIGFNQKKRWTKKMKSIGQNLEESNTYSIFVYAISLKYYKIFRKIFLSSYYTISLFYLKYQLNLNIWN